MNRLNIEEKVQGLNALWQKTKGAEQICIAVLDGPVDTTHSCFDGKNIKRLDTLVPQTATIQATDTAARHGTHITSILFGSHSSQVKGIAPLCRGILLPIFGQNKAGDIKAASQIDLARAIEQAIAAGAHIINVSGGQLSNTGEAQGFLLNAIKACKENNVLLVAAAGNDGCECLHVPAALSSTLAVGSMDDHGTPLAHSNWGQNYANNGILASGHQIIGAIPNEQTTQLSGTSFATPIVSGIAALLLSLQISLGQKPDPEKVRQAILASATPCHSNNIGELDCRRFLAGTINVFAAQQLILNGGNINMSNENETVTTPTTQIESGLMANMVNDTAMNSATAPLIDTAPAVNEVNTLIGPSEAQVEPSGCACGGGDATLAYVLGTVGFNFGSQTRKDAFIQAMPAGKNNPDDPQQLLKYLKANPYESQSIIWTLNLDATPIYAIVPNGPYASVVYERLREVMQAQLDNGVDMVSIPGIATGSATLSDGQVVPQIIPNPRGMYSWATSALVESALGECPSDESEKEVYQANASGLTNFLDRIYYDKRNLGTSAQDRALNYSATNAFQASQVIETATKGRFELDDIAVKKSPVCRPGSDCYDVVLVFFNPQNSQNANKVYRFTVDVSGVIPVTIGQVRSWSRK